MKQCKDCGRRYSAQHFDGAAWLCIDALDCAAAIACVDCGSRSTKLRRDGIDWRCDDGIGCPTGLPIAMQGLAPIPQPPKCKYCGRQNIGDLYFSGSWRCVDDMACAARGQAMMQGFYHPDQMDTYPPPPPEVPIHQRKCTKCKNKSLRLVVLPDSTENVAFCKLCGHTERSK